VPRPHYQSHRKQGLWDIVTNSYIPKFGDRLPISTIVDDGKLGYRLGVWATLQTRSPTSAAGILTGKRRFDSHILREVKDQVRLKIASVMKRWQSRAVAKKHQYRRVRAAVHPTLFPNDIKTESAMDRVRATAHIPGNLVSGPARPVRYAVADAFNILSWQIPKKPRSIHWQAPQNVASIQRAMLSERR
jgi:hypothetical protein